LSDNNLQRIREIAVSRANASTARRTGRALDQGSAASASRKSNVLPRRPRSTARSAERHLRQRDLQVGANVAKPSRSPLDQHAHDADRQDSRLRGAAAYNSSVSVGQQGAGVVAANALTTTSRLPLHGPGRLRRCFSRRFGDHADGGQRLRESRRHQWRRHRRPDGDRGYDLELTSRQTATNGYALSVNGGGAIGDDCGPHGFAARDQQSRHSIADAASRPVCAGVFTLDAVDGRNIDLAQTATATEGFQAATANNNTGNAALTWAAGTATFTAVVHPPKGGRLDHGAGCWRRGPRLRSRFARLVTRR